MDGILEILGYIAVGIFVIFNRLYRRKKTNENDYGLTEDGKLKLPFIDELIAVSYTHLTLPTICSV